MTPWGLAFNTLALVVGGWIYFQTSRGAVDPRLRFVAATGLASGALVAHAVEILAEGRSQAPLDLINPLFGGRTILGGVIGGWIAVEIAKRHFGITRPTGDAFALALAAGEAVGRIGCWFNGCCFGRACGLPWAVYQQGAWRHPTQFYSSVSAALTFLVLVYARPRLATGQTFAIYLLLFGVSRAALEPFRADFGTGLPPIIAIVASLGLAGAGVVLFMRRSPG